jgi:hypothetical protein
MAKQAESAASWAGRERAAERRWTPERGWGERRQRGAPWDFGWASWKKKLGRNSTGTMVGTQHGRTGTRFRELERRQRRFVGAQGRWRLKNLREGRRDKDRSAHRGRMKLELAAAGGKKSAGGWILSQELKRRGQQIKAAAAKYQSRRAREIRTTAGRKKKSAGKEMKSRLGNRKYRATGNLVAGRWSKEQAKVRLEETSAQEDEGRERMCT